MGLPIKISPAAAGMVAMRMKRTAPDIAWRLLSPAPSSLNAASVGNTTNPIALPISVSGMFINR